MLEQLYSLVNERYEDERSILVTTNLGLEELEEQIGTRTVSRLVEICGDQLPLFGADQRIAYDPRAPRWAERHAGYAGYAALH